jgi:hypothetical protein
MGAYRPYSKTLYWTCWSAATFAIFAFSHFHAFSHFRISAHIAFSRISHFHVFHIFTHFAYFAFSHLLRTSHFRFIAFSCISRIMHISRFHTVRNSCTRISRRFRILAFFAFRHALLRASLGPIAFCSHVLSSSSKVHWWVSHLVSLALYHICPCIHIYAHLSHYVFILHHPCMFSATYSAPRPGNSLNMLTCQRIVRSF